MRRHSVVSIYNQITRVKNHVGPGVLACYKYSGGADIVDMPYLHRQSYTIKYHVARGSVWDDYVVRVVNIWLFYFRLFFKHRSHCPIWTQYQRFWEYVLCVAQGIRKQKRSYHVLKFETRFFDMSKNFTNVSKKTLVAGFTYDRLRNNAFWLCKAAQILYVVF